MKRSSGKFDLIFKGRELNASEMRMTKAGQKEVPGCISLNIGYFVCITLIIGNPQ